MTPHLIFPLALLVALPAHGQSLMEGSEPGTPVHLLPSDAAVLEGPEIRKDLPCAVTAISPELGFDLGFHTGYEVTVPLRELAGSGNSLTAIFRVTPGTHPGNPIYFWQKWDVPPIEQDTQGAAHLRGEFVLGEGKYRVDWLMRDRAERFCAGRWRISAEPRRKDRLTELRMPPGTARSEVEDLFGNEAPVEREGQRPLHVVVLLHVAPQAAGAAAMLARETEALLSTLRSIAREPRIGIYSIAAFNLEHNQILYRRDAAPIVDFPALGEAIKQLHLGTVDVQKLIEKDGRARFLTSLAVQEIESNRPDALIFVGPKTAGDSLAVSRSLKELGEPPCPVFYLNYDAHPNANPWKDSIGSVVKFWKGMEYTITEPRDLSVAWTGVMSRLTDKRPATGVPGRSALITDLVSKK